MVVQFRDEYEKRLYEANQKILECYAMLDPSDDDYTEKMEALAKLQKEIAVDYKAYGDLDIEEAQNKLEEEKLVHEKKSSKIGHILQGAGLALSGCTFIFGQVMKDKHFKRASKFEEENAYLKTSDKKAVDDALRDDQPTKNFFQFWK